MAPQPVLLLLLLQLIHRGLLLLLPVAFGKLLLLHAAHLDGVQCDMLRACSPVPLLQVALFLI